MGVHLRYFIACIITALVSVFIVPVAVPMPADFLYSIPLVGMIVLFFLISPQRAWQWAWMTGFAIDLMRIPYSPTVFIVLCVAWCILFGVSRVTLGLPRIMREAVGACGVSAGYGIISQVIAHVSLGTLPYNGWFYAVMMACFHTIVSVFVLWSTRVAMVRFHARFRIGV